MNNLTDVFGFLNTVPGLLLVIAVLAALLLAARFPLRRSAARQNTGLILVLLGLMTVSLFCLFLSFGFARKGDVSASVVPRLWILGLIACCVYLLVDALRGKQERDPAAEHTGLSFLFIGLSFAYFLLIGLVGFYISTVLFLVASMLILAYRRWPVLLAVTAGWILFAYLVFARVLFVPLPNGAWIEMLMR